MLKKIDIDMMSPLIWAYMGDAVYEQFVRDYLINQGILKRIEQKLSEEELSIVRRGRNSNPHSHAKNADIVDYKLATGLEALIGYLHLTKQEKRLKEILKMCVES